MRLFKYFQRSDFVGPRHVGVRLAKNPVARLGLREQIFRWWRHVVHSRPLNTWRVFWHWYFRGRSFIWHSGLRSRTIIVNRWLVLISPILFAAFLGGVFNFFFTIYQTVATNRLERESLIEARAMLADVESRLRQQLDRQVDGGRQVDGDSVAGSADAEGAGGDEVAQLRGELFVALDEYRELVGEFTEEADTLLRSRSLLKNDIDSLQAQLAAVSAENKGRGERIAALDQQRAEEARLNAQLKAHIARLDDDLTSTLGQVISAENRAIEIESAVQALNQRVAHMTGSPPTGGTVQERVAFVSDSVAILHNNQLAQAQDMERLLKIVEQRNSSSLARINTTRFPVARLIESGLLPQPLGGMGLDSINFESESLADFDETQRTNVFSIADFLTTARFKIDLREKLEIIDSCIPTLVPTNSDYYYSSGYGMRRHPVTKKREFHAGLDIVAPWRSPVLASAPGKVVTAGRFGAYGKTVRILHNCGFESVYAHLNRIQVRKGDIVQPLQKIGLLGNTGRSTGPHIHYEIRFRGKTYDPQPFLRAGKIAEAGLDSPQ